MNGAGMISRVNLKNERDRIAKVLGDQIRLNASESGWMMPPDGVLPSPKLLNALHLKQVSLSAVDAALILEIFETLDYVHRQALDAQENYLHANGQIESAKVAYQDRTLKNSKDKATAAVRSLGLKANDGNLNRDRYLAYLRHSPFSDNADRIKAIENIASGKMSEARAGSYEAVFQSIKRELKRLKSSGETVHVTLPRES